MLNIELGKFITELQKMPKDSLIQAQGSPNRLVRKVYLEKDYGTKYCIILEESSDINLPAISVKELIKKLNNVANYYFIITKWDSSDKANCIASFASKIKVLAQNTSNGGIGSVTRVRELKGGLVTLHTEWDDYKRATIKEDVVSMKVLAELAALEEELEPYRGTLVLTGFKVVRLVGVQDGEDDYYWIYDEGRKMSGESCVGKWIALKGHLPTSEYDRLLRVWNLNNENKAI